MYMYMYTYIQVYVYMYIYQWGLNRNSRASWSSFDGFGEGSQVERLQVTDVYN